jgi:hypothetical protein
VLSLGPFQILDLSDDADDAVLYREVYDRDDVTHDQDQVKFHRDAFESLWAVSLSEPETLAAITREAAEIRSGLDENGAGDSRFDAET